MNPSLGLEVSKENRVAGHVVKPLSLDLPTEGADLYGLVMDCRKPMLRKIIRGKGSLDSVIYQC